MFQPVHNLIQVAKYVTPLGTVIDHQGIRPDKACTPLGSTTPPAVFMPGGYFSRYYEVCTAFHACPVGELYASHQMSNLFPCSDLLGTNIMPCEVLNRINILPLQSDFERLCVAADTAPEYAGAL